MAGEIRYRGRATQIGLSLTATVYDDAGAVSGSSIVMTEQGTNTGFYTGNMPVSGPSTVGRYMVRIFDGSTELGSGDLFWDGKQEVDVAYIRKILCNTMLTNPSSGVLSIFDDNDSTVLVAGNIWEDVGPSQSYQGSGIERRDRLS